MITSKLKNSCEEKIPHFSPLHGDRINQRNLLSCYLVSGHSHHTNVVIFFLHQSSFISYFLYLHFKCYPESSLYPPPALLPYPPTPTSWPWHSPVLGHIPRASPPIDGQLGHPMLHMQLEIQLWGVLVTSYRCSSYWVADPFSSLGTFSSYFIRGTVSIQ